jgi:MFS family permease
MIAAPTLRLAAAGFVATAMAFGPARMGFGLFLPEFRDAFALSTTLAGFVASGGFLAFLLALPATSWLGARIGQRAPVMVGALSATIGFAVVATASDSTALAVGIALAGASAGFCWSPFNDAAERVVPESARPSALSAISTGTATGVAAAAWATRASAPPHRGSGAARRCRSTAWRCCSARRTRSTSPSPPTASLPLAACPCCRIGPLPR